MLTGTLKTVKKQVGDRLKATNNPFELMSVVCDLMSKATDDDDIEYTMNFKHDTAKLVDDAFADFDSIDDIEVYLKTIHDSYISACIMAMLSP